MLSLAYGRLAFTLIATLIIAGSAARFAVIAIETYRVRLHLAGVSPLQIQRAISILAAC